MGWNEELLLLAELTTTLEYGVLLLVLDAGVVGAGVTVTADLVDVNFVYLSVTVVLLYVEGGIVCVLGRTAPVAADAGTVVV